MNSLLNKNLSLMDFTSVKRKKCFADIQISEELDYQLFNEIELRKEGKSPLLVIMGVENINALRTIGEELRRYTAIVAEPDLSRLKHLISNKDLQDLIEARNIVFVAGEDVDRLGNQIEMYFSIAMIDHVKTIKPIESRQKEFRQAFQNLNEFQQSAEANRSTVEKFLTDWYRFFANNLFDYLNTPALSRWENVLEGDTLTIVGPGPSIDQEIESLRSLSDGWIIALDTVLPLFNQIGISPDIVVSVDAGEANLPFLEDFPSESTLVCPAYMDPRVIEKAETCFLFDTRFPPNQWVNQNWESPGFLPLSGSVSTAALGLARMLNPSECYLLGLDLSAPGLLTHSRQLPDYQNALDQLNRFKTIPGILYQQLSERNIQTLETPMGSVLTTGQYINWKESFEVMIESCDFPFYRLGRKILPVDGARTTRRIHDFHPRQHGELPIVYDDRLIDHNRWMNRTESLLTRIQELQIELETINSKIRREHPIGNDWLTFAGKLGQDKEFLDYFHWEIDRVTQELQQIEQVEQLEEVAGKQYRRWKILLEETKEGVEQSQVAGTSSTEGVRNRP